MNVKIALAALLCSGTLLALPPTSASAAPVSGIGQSRGVATPDTPLLQKVHRWWRRGWGWGRPYYGYAYGYGYGYGYPYYRPYYPAYRPYYYGYSAPYYPRYYAPTYYYARPYYSYGYGYYPPPLK